MTEELKPCPFCGSKLLFASTSILSAALATNQMKHINCQDCGARHSEGKWNTRAESAEVLDECWALIAYDKDGKTFATCIGETAQEVWTQSYMAPGWPGFTAMRVKIVRAE